MCWTCGEHFINLYWACGERVMNMWWTCHEHVMRWTAGAAVTSGLLCVRALCETSYLFSCRGSACDYVIAQRHALTHVLPSISGTWRLLVPSPSVAHLAGDRFWLRSFDTHQPVASCWHYWDGLLSSCDWWRRTCNLMACQVLSWSMVM